MLDRGLMEQLMFGTGRVRRFTQDSPVLPDVWLEYAKDGEPVKLLLTPWRDAHTGEIRRELRRRLDAERTRARIVYNQSTVAATLGFEDLIRAVLPMTDWWQRLDRDWKLQDAATETGQENLARAVMDPEHPPLLPAEQGERRPPPELLWLIRVVGALALVRRGERLPEVFHDEKRGVAGAGPEDWKPIVRAVADLIRGVRPAAGKARIFLVSLNRDASPTVTRSMLAVKADAARRLFEISCRDLAWAVIDSGIDARHPAFRKRKADESSFDQAFADGENRTRVEDTFDFTRIQDILDPDMKQPPESLKERMADDPDLKQKFKALKKSLDAGGSVDWNLLAPLLRVPHDGRYRPPATRNDHGTHVAGILAGDWRSRDTSLLKDDLKGVCPDLRLYDFRVLDDEGSGDEFTVMAALQLVRHLNSTNDYMTVHGVNLSLSIPHDVSNYACGRTPVCDECERVVSSGVVVVAAAGNQGYRKYTTPEGTTEGYSSISITDPGNAELVITVGATHRYRPHTYGVSYFSSRGPTGDGRIKPDLVAPGEKITAPLPDGMFGLKDGTSMAAPHVSGVAAMLMARHNELVGRPARIKQILCSTATDLGRERYFQGAGMLDALRALQSV